ncbi:hypothetical protein B296_00057270 [Ensete ventricosum]|uniref:Uncharacterized protein n=1 Tax=Ensete ventricosum TaxID=4639 RepID=A0A426X120_ENSVE|nr:hypothetical protein B296_00057270 [Ensete ventricosum]
MGSRIGTDNISVHRYGPVSAYKDATNNFQNSPKNRSATTTKEGNKSMREYSKPDVSKVAVQDTIGTTEQGLADTGVTVQL